VLLRRIYALIVIEHGTRRAQPGRQHREPRQRADDASGAQLPDGPRAGVFPTSHPVTSGDAGCRRSTSGDPENGAESVLTPHYGAPDLPAETAGRSTITQIYEGTNQIQPMVLARQLLKG
jgi:hypothetical protein